MPKGDGRGGSRKHPADCKCGNCPKVGRKKKERPVNDAVARKIKARVKAEELWVFLIGQAAKKAKESGNTADLRAALIYLDDRDLGVPTHTVNHLHDKPLQVDVNVSHAETIRKVRLRKEEYERSRRG